MELKSCTNAFKFTVLWPRWQPDPCLKPYLYKIALENDFFLYEICNKLLECQKYSFSMKSLSFGGFASAPAPLLHTLSQCSNEQYRIIMVRLFSCLFLFFFQKIVFGHFFCFLLRSCVATICGPFRFLFDINRVIRKRTFGHKRPAKIQISLRIRAVWSESTLGAFWIAKDSSFLYADNEDSNQTARTCRLTWVFVERTYEKIFFSRRGSYDILQR